MGRPKNTEKSFHTKYKKMPSGCWEWQGGKLTGGYGEFKINFKNVTSHRFSYEIHKGKIPKGMCVCHSCDNPPCVNPEHLWLGTSKENTSDRHNKGRTPKGERIFGSKLKTSDVLEIRKYYAENKHKAKWGGVVMAKKYGVLPTTIDWIAKGKTWKHLLPKA